jgi:hypothetical protein
MANAHLRFRFTIGQGMMVIAALAVAFAIMPLGVAILMSILITCLILLMRERIQSRRPIPKYGPDGCTLSFFGMLVAMVTAPSFYKIALASGRAGDAGLWALLCCLAAALTGILIVQYLVAKYAIDPNSTANPLDSKRARTQAELERVDHLLKCALEDDDEIVISKLSEYRARLDQELRS